MFSNAADLQPAASRKSELLYLHFSKTIPALQEYLLQVDSAKWLGLRPCVSCLCQILRRFRGLRGSKYFLRGSTFYVGDNFMYVVWVIYFFVWVKIFALVKFFFGGLTFIY